MFFSDDHILTGDIAGGNLGYYSTGGINAEINIENPGLTPSGDAFVSIQTDDDRTEVCLSKGMGRRFSLKYNTPSLPIPLRLAVVAVEGEKTLVYGFDRAVWYKGDQIENSFKVGDRRYRNDIFPYAWLRSIHFVTAKSNDGTVIISTTGQTGMAIIGMRWNP